MEAHPDKEQQRHPYYKEKIDGEEGQQDLNNDTCAGLRHRQTTPAQQSHPYYPTAHAGDG